MNMEESGGAGRVSTRGDPPVCRVTWDEKTHDFLNHHQSYNSVNRKLNSGVFVWLHLKNPLIQ